MATLLSVPDFRERFDIDDDIVDGRLEPAIRSAAKRLRTWVTDAVYDAAVEDAEENDPADITVDLQNAEAHLAFHFAIVGLNSPLAAKGVVKQARSEEGGGHEIRMYLAPDETAQLSTQLLELAREIVEPWISQAQTSGIQIVKKKCDD